MRHRPLPLVLVGLLACSSAENTTPPDPPPRQLPTECRRTDRTGTYQVFYIFESGNCGQIASEIVNFDAPQGASGDGGTPPCVVDFERWSEADCKLERTVTCKTADGEQTVVAVSRQQTANGSWVAGIATFDVRPRAGAPCRGTYSIDAFRQ